MGRKLVPTAFAAIFLGSASATAGELPTYEKSGFPITRVQVSVLGSAGVRERSPTPSLTLQGMPASPHQVAVLTPRKKTVADGGRPSPSIPGSRNVTAYRASGE